MGVQRAEICSVLVLFFVFFFSKLDFQTKRNSVHRASQEKNKQNQRKSTILYISISLGNRHQNGNTFLRQDRFVIYLFNVQRYSTLYKINRISLNVYFSNVLICSLKPPARVQVRAHQALGLVTQGLSPSTKKGGLFGIPSVGLTQQTLQDFSEKTTL